MALARHHQASGSKPTSLFPKPLSPEPEREAGSDDPEPNSPPDKGEIQRTLQDTTARAISKGSMEPGNVILFNMMPHIQPPQRWLNICEAMSLWICIAPMLKREQLETVVV